MTSAYDRICLHGDMGSRHGDMGFSVAIDPDILYKYTIIRDIGSQPA